MTKRWVWMLAGVAAGAIVIAVIVVAAVMGTKRGGPGEQLEFPIRWAAATPEQGAPWENSTVELREDGSAVVVELIVGEIGEGQAGELCVDPVPAAFSGTAKWTTDAEGHLRVDTEGGVALFSPWPGRFDGADWGSLHQELCDGSPADFAALTTRRQ